MVLIVPRAMPRYFIFGVVLLFGFPYILYIPSCYFLLCFEGFGNCLGKEEIQGSWGRVEWNPIGNVRPKWILVYEWRVVERSNMPTIWIGFIHRDKWIVAWSYDYKKICSIHKFKVKRTYFMHETHVKHWETKFPTLTKEYVTSSPFTLLIILPFYICVFVCHFLRRSSRIIHVEEWLFYVGEWHENIPRIMRN